MDHKEMILFVLSLFFSNSIRAHDITVDQNSHVYVGDVYWRMRLQKFMR